jgi:hypothetical protein
VLTPAERQQLIDTIRTFPTALEAAVEGLTDEQIKARTLEGEWTVREIVHHVADSHMNAFIRVKLILTEEHPPLKPYQQEIWAQLADVTETPLEASFAILRGVHARWAAIFEHVADNQWSLTGFHPENGDMSIEDLLKYYAWHGDNHIEQIQRTVAAGVR